MRDEDEQLYRKHAEELIRFATFLVGPDDAPDVVNEAVLRAFTSRAWPEVVERRAYLFRTVLNEARMVRRSERRRRTREQRTMTPPPADDIDGAQDALALVARLSPRQRAVIYLAYWDDLDPATAAELLGISEGSVRRHLARGRASLRRMPMTTDLDTRIRALVLNVVGTAPPAPDLTVGAPAAAPVRRSRVLVAFAVAVIVVLVIAGVALVSRGDDAAQPARRAGGTVVVDLDDIPMGVSADAFRGTPVFLVRAGDEVTVLISNPQRFPTETEMWWCPRERVFGNPTGGEVFDRDGDKLGGPAVRGMDRLETRVARDRVKIVLDRVILGSTLAAGPATRLGHGPPDTDEWNTGRSSFCHDAVVAGAGTVRIPLDRIMEGVSASRSRKGRQLVVRDGRDIDLFQIRRSLVTNEQSVAWCPREQVFYAPGEAGGTQFDTEGRVVAGEAVRGLDRVPVRVVGDGLVIDQAEMTPGAPARDSVRPAPRPPCTQMQEVPAGASLRP